MNIEHIPVGGTSDFAIGNCRITFECPQLWSALAETDDPLVRACGTCVRKVYMCVTPDEVEAHAMAGNCIAYGSPRDTKPPFVGNLEVPYFPIGGLPLREPTGLIIAPSPLDQRAELDGPVNWD